MKRINLLVYITLICCFTLTSTGSKAQTLLAQNFDTSTTFPPTGWQNNLIVQASNNPPTDGGPGAPIIWSLSTVSGSAPLSNYGNDVNNSPAVAYSGIHSAGFNSWNIRSGGIADLVTPAINLTPYPGGTNKLTFYTFRYGGDPMKVYVNTAPNITGGTLLTSFNSSTGGSWTLSTTTIPSTYTGNIYIIFEASSNWDNDQFVDDVIVTHSGCVGTPSASAITNAPLATPLCSGNTYTLNAAEANTISGSTTPGISGYWQQSASASGPWVNAVGGSGANTLNYTTPTLNSSVYYRFADTCTFSHQGAASAAYYVPVNLSTSISAQPQTTNACTGGNASFTIGALGGSLTYQWQVSIDGGVTFNNITNGGVYGGARSATLNLTGVPITMNGYQYQVVVTGSCGPSKTSNPVSVFVGPAPAIVTQPRDSTVCALTPVSFSVGATGIGLSYQWQINTGSGFVTLPNGIGYTGATTSTLTQLIPNTTMNGYQYRVVVSGACSPVTSTFATLHVNGLPTITSQPANAITCNNANALFTVGATGAGLNYQWQVSTGGAFSPVSGGVYSGTNTDSLILTGVTTAMNGYVYRSIITGTCAPKDTTIVDTLHINPLPAVGITAYGNTTICPSDSASFVGLFTPGYTYQWYYNNTAIPGAVRDTFRANPAGGYKIGITNGFGCTSFSATDSVHYLAAPAVAITAGGPLGFCQGSSVTLTGTTNAGVTYAWKLNGNFISNANNPADTAMVSGSYVLYENNGTCGTLSAPLVVTASPIPQAAITNTGSATFCSGQTVTLNANTGTGYTYQWSLDGTAQPNGSTRTFTAGIAGNYTVQVFSGPGCSATSSIYPVFTIPSPAAVATPSNSTFICPGAATMLNANALANTTYQWNLNSTAISGATYAAYSATTGGSYTVSVTSGNGCSATSSPVVVTALAAPAANITSNHADTLCSPDSLTLVTAQAPGLSYQWYNNSTILADTLNTLVVHNTGNYSVKVSNPGCSATSSSVYVASGITPTGNITYAAPGTICGSTPTLLTAPGGTNYRYQWYEAGTPISGAFSQFYGATAPGVYAVVVTTPLGCTLTTTSATITTGTIPNPIISQVVSQLCAPGFATWQWNFNNQPIAGETNSCTNINLPGGYSVTVTNTAGCAATSSIYDVLNNSVASVNLKDNIRLYPNPASSVIYIDAPVQVNVTVAGIDGKLLMHAEKTKAINIEGLANGMYMISVYDQDNHLLRTDKVVKN